MAKIYFSTRDDITAIDPNTIAAIIASGNYSRVITSYKKELLLTIGISKVESALNSIPEKPKFVRLGRSVIVNHAFFQKIDLLNQTLTLSCHGREIQLRVNKAALKSYKELITKNFTNKNENNSAR